MKTKIVLAILLAPVSAWAGGLKHAESWELNRDGAWVVNFLILFSGLFYLVKRFILPELKKRSEEIAKNLEDTEKARMDAMKNLSELEQKLRKFEEDAEQMKQDAIAEGAKIKNEIVEEAKAQSRRIVEKAKAEIEAEALRAKMELKSATAELAVKVARDILTENIKASDQPVIVKEYIERLKG